MLVEQKPTKRKNLVARKTKQVKLIKKIVVKTTTQKTTKAMMIVVETAENLLVIAHLSTLHLTSHFS
jgi:hypothetical protein